MHTIAKNAIAFFLEKNRIPTPKEIQAEHPAASGQKIAFVTLYKSGRIIASSGRVRCLKQDTLSELIDNACKVVEDSRFAGAGIQKAKDLETVKIRVDLIEKPRLVNAIDKIQFQNEGILVIDQNQGKLGVILPKIAPALTSSQELFELALEKAKIAKDTPLSSLVLYALSSEIYSNF